MFYTLNIDPALSSLVLNVFLLIVGYRYLEKKTMIYTVLAVFELPMFLKYTQEWPVFVPENLVVASVAAGVFVGIALGLSLFFGICFVILFIAYSVLYHRVNKNFKAVNHD